MKRPFLATFLAVFLALTVPAFAAGLPATLRANALVEGETLKLGDLWENLGDKGETVIAAAPQPGKRVSLDARWLAAVANGFGIDWRPMTAFDRIVVERAGQSVDPRLIDTELREALALEGLPPGSSFDISNRSVLSNLMIPAGQPATVGVRDVVLDTRMNRFSATIELPANAPNATRVRVSGRTFITARIPVLTRVINRGEVITAKDVVWQEIREEGVRRDIVTDIAQLVGTEPRMTMRAGVPVRLSEVRLPVLVEKHSQVTIVLKTPFMQLTAIGKALDEGGKGDTVHVLNTRTKQTVEGRVVAPGTVAVAPGGARIVMN
ncbi:MAG: flagellar basal body P-ring formation protein FlgA [Magnetospirillum sp.]|nr:flagellar basal body P-ring formation protein FlgA [Magnetospirillum sp.]